MTINLFHIVLSFICNGNETVMFFRVVRIILTIKMVRRLQAFDETGRMFVDGVIDIVERSVYRLWQKKS